MIFTLVRIDAEYLAELGRTNDDGCGIDKTQYHRVRQEIQQDAQPEHTKGQLKQTDHQGKQHRVAYKSLASRRREGLQCRCGHQ